MIQPVVKDEALVAEIKSTDGDSGFRLWWFGQSGFLLQHEDKHLLFDPYLSDSLTVKYAETDKPHTRMTERVIDPGLLDFVDVVTSTHNHTDHLDAETLQPLFEVNAELKLVLPEANIDFAKNRLGCDDRRMVGFTSGETKQVNGIEITGVPAAHEKMDVDETGRHLYMGFIVNVGGFHIYHSGDTMMYEGMAELLKRYRVDFAILPINGQLAARRVSGNLWGREAARLAKAVGALKVIPCHYEMFEFNTATTDEFIGTCEAIGQPYAVLKCGECYSYTPAE